MSKFEDFSNADVLTKLRFKLIKILAGKSLIIINARVSIVDKHTDKSLIIRGIKGGLISHNTFPDKDGQILMLEQKTHG